MFFEYLNLRLLRRIWEYAWPTAVYSLLETAVGLVDIYLAGSLGADAVASIGFARQIFLVLMIGTLSITTGTITMVAQYCGAKQYQKASAVAHHSLALSVVSGLFIGIIGIFISQPLISSLGASQMVVEQGTAYLQVLMAGVLFMMINFSTNAVFRALGDTRTPLKIAITVNIFNVIFSYTLLNGIWIFPPLGVVGIALGTVIARMIGSYWGLVLLSDRERQVRVQFRASFDRDIFKRILSIGVPSGFSGFFRNGARIMFFAIIAATEAGTTAVAAATVGFQIRMLAIMPALAFQVATSALVGQSIGAGKIRRAEEYGLTAIVFCSLLLAFLSLIVFLFPRQMVSLFTDDPEVLFLSILTLRAIAFEQFCNCVSIIASGALSGAGDTRPSMNYTLVSQWLLMLPLAYLLAEKTEYDITGAWIAWGFAPFIQMVLTLSRYFGGHWKTLRVTSM
ncbi:MAG: MATE family efflux transporter [bacterium]